MSTGLIGREIEELGVELGRLSDRAVSLVASSDQGSSAAGLTIEDYFSEDRSFPPSEQFVSQAVMPDPAVYGRAEADWRGFLTVDVLRGLRANGRA